MPTFLLARKPKAPRSFVDVKEQNDKSLPGCQTGIGNKDYNLGAYRTEKKQLWPETTVTICSNIPSR